MATITDTWTLISPTGVLVQKFGSKVLSLTYASTTPTTEDGFSMTMSGPQQFPAVAGKSIYAKARTGKTVSISYEVVAA